MEIAEGVKRSGTTISAADVVSVVSSAGFPVLGKGIADPSVFCKTQPKSALLVAIVVNAEHEKGEIFSCQLWHAGRASHFVHQPDGEAPASSTGKSIVYGWNILMPVDNREDYSKPRALVISEIPGTVNPFHLVTRNDMAARAGFSNMAHRYTISACKVGGQRAADLTLVWPKLGRSGLDLPDLSATHCRSWLDLTIWNKIQDHTAPRQQIERNRQRLRRGRTVSDMQKNHCRFGSDPYDLVHIQAQS